MQDLGKSKLSANKYQAYASNNKAIYEVEN